jgi:hypothetical protein
MDTPRDPEQKIVRFYMWLWIYHKDILLRYDDYCRKMRDADKTPVKISRYTEKYFSQEWEEFSSFEASYPDKYRLLYG